MRRLAEASGRGQRRGARWLVPGGLALRDDLAQREPTMWRYRELLPVDRDQVIISLGETITPLIEGKRLARHFNMRRLIIKDESRLPTGSFKSRGMAMAVSMAKALGIKRVAAPTAGNAGANRLITRPRTKLPPAVIRSPVDPFGALWPESSMIGVPA